MAEETQAPQEQQPQDESKEPAPVPYERFKEVNEGYKQLRAEMEKIRAEQKQAEEAKLKEQNDFKALYEKLQSELKTEKLNSVRLKVAGKKNIPVDLVDRLRGETEEEIEKDAEGLLAFIKQPEQKGQTPPPPRGGTSTAFNFETATPQQVREYLAGQLKNQ